MPPDWGFFHDEMLVEHGYLLWAADGLDPSKKPTIEQVLASDPLWDTDLMMRHRLQRRMDHFKKNGGETGG